MNGNFGRKAVFVSLLLIFVIFLSQPTLAADVCTHAQTYCAPSDTDGMHKIICKECGALISEEPCVSDDLGCGEQKLCALCSDYFGIPLPYDPADELSANEKYHYYECVNCGSMHEGTEEEHKFGNWFTALSPTEEWEGERARRCTVCGYAETSVLPKLDPTDSDNGGLIFILIAATSAAAGVCVFLYKKGYISKILEKLRK